MGLFFNLEIECDNEAFGDNPQVETARILRVLADKLDSLDDTYYPMFDVNGNLVGSATFFSEP